MYTKTFRISKDTAVTIKSTPVENSKELANLAKMGLIEYDGKNQGLENIAKKYYETTLTIKNGDGSCDTLPNHYRTVIKPDDETEVQSEMQRMVNMFGEELKNGKIKIEGVNLK